MKERIKEKEAIQKHNATHKSSLGFNKKKTTLKDISEIKDEKMGEKTNIKFVTIKSPYFKIEKNSLLNKKRHPKNSFFNEGRWKKDEQIKFIQGISLYGNNWKKVKSFIRTRTAIQLKSHAQKFYNKIKIFKDDNLGIDFTLNSIKNFNDMIKQIKNINPNYDIINIFMKLSYRADNRKIFKRIKNKYITNNFEKDKNSLLISKEQKNLISQEKENNYLINNKFIFNQHKQNIININNNDLNNNLNHIFFKNNNFNISSNNLYMINNSIKNNNIINILK